MWPGEGHVPVAQAVELAAVCAVRCAVIEQIKKTRPSTTRTSKITPASLQKKSCAQPRERLDLLDLARHWYHPETRDALLTGCLQESGFSVALRNALVMLHGNLQSVLITSSRKHVCRTCCLCNPSFRQGDSRCCTSSGLPAAAAAAARGRGNAHCPTPGGVLDRLRGGEVSCELVCSRCE